MFMQIIAEKKVNSKSYIIRLRVVFASLIDQLKAFKQRDFIKEYLRWTMSLINILAKRVVELMKYRSVTAGEWGGHRKRMYVKLRKYALLFAKISY